MPNGIVSGDYLGAALDLNGQYAVAGARYADPAGNSSGEVVPFHRSGSQFAAEPIIAAWDGSAEDQFGTTVAIGDDWMAVAAPYHNVNSQIGAGKIYVYRRFGGSAGSWSWFQDFNVPTTHAFDDFGLSLDMQGNSFAAGAPFRDVSGMSDAGAVLVGEAVLISGNPFAANWGTSLITAGDAHASDHFGSSVVLMGNALYVAAPDADVNGAVDAGAVYVFIRNGFASYWQFDKFYIPLASPGAHFGKSMAADGNGLIISDANGNIYRYRQPDIYNPNALYTLGRQSPPAGAASTYGQSLALSGTTMVVGDFYHAFTPNGAEGAVYVLSAGLNDDCTNAIQYPEKALRDVPLSEAWSVGSPLPTPTSFPAPETRNTTSLSVIGTVRPCPSCTSTANMATSSPSALISLRSAVRMSFEAGPVVSRVVLSTCLPSLKPRASSEPGAYFTTQAACESFFTSFAPRLWPL